MGRESWLKWAVFLFFAVSALIHLYPLPLHMPDAAHDLGDPLLNAWIISSVQTGILSRPAKLFDTKAFYPYKRTLSYSEHLFPLAIASLPLVPAARNPLLIHNLLLFLFFALNGWTMYLLTRHLTGNHPAGIVAGVVFAFNAYQIQHLSHLQLLTSWCLPLAFYFLHRFFETRQWKESCLFSSVLTIQALASVYYGLFFVSILAVALPILLILHARSLKRQDLVRLFVPMAISAVVLFFFSLPYFSLFKTFEFKRDLAPGADLMNYFAARSENALFGRWLGPLGSPERFLFPGLAALLLALVFMFRQKKLLRLVPAKVRIGLIALTLVGAAGVLVLAATGGFRLSFGPFRISGHNMDRYALPFLLGSILLLLTSFLAFNLKGKPDSGGSAHFYLYFSILVWSLFLSFGSVVTAFGKPLFEGKSYSFLWTPFRWFYAFFPGFKGIRVPSRYAVFVVLGVAVMAGFGFTIIRGSLKKAGPRIAAAALFVCFMNAEYFSAPQRIRYIPSPEKIPAAYRYIAGLPENASLAEVPFFGSISRDAVFMYFSLFHQKDIVNGYSGFIPPGILYVREVFKAFPSRDCLDILDALGVRYVLIHPKAWKENRRARVRERLREDFPDILREIRTFPGAVEGPFEYARIFGDEILYEVHPQPAPRPRAPGRRELSRDAWLARSELNPGLLPLLNDGRIDTAWTTARPKTPEDVLRIEFPKPEEVTQISLCLDSQQAYDRFAVGLHVWTSEDGIGWIAQQGAYAPGEFARGLVDEPKTPVQKIYLDGRRVRAVRLQQTGSHRYAPWAVAELRVFVR